MPFEHVRCEECPIRYSAVCSLCNVDELAYLDRIKSYKTYAPGALIAEAGMPMQFVASVVTGIAMLSKVMQDGRRSTVGFLFASDFVGRAGSKCSPFNVEAKSEVLLCRFRRTEFEKLLNDSLAINQRLLTITTDDLEAARNWIPVLARKSSREKVASLLLLFFEKNARSLQKTPESSTAFKLPVTREEAADFLGLSLETVSRRFSDLKGDGIISMKGARNIRILSLSALKRESGDLDGTAP